MNLDEAAIAHPLRVEDVIRPMERSLADFSNGKVVQPVRQIDPCRRAWGLLGLMLIPKEADPLRPDQGRGLRRNEPVALPVKSCVDTPRSGQEGASFNRSRQGSTRSGE